MYWLTLSCLLEFGFAQLFKHAQRRGYYAPVVVSTNYLALAAALGLYLGLTGQLDLSPQVLKVGLTTGVVFICSMSIMTKSLNVVNVAAVLIAFRMSIIVPIFLAVWLWDEPISGYQVAGIVVALLGLWMLTRGADSTHGARARGRRALAIVVIVFGTQGISQSCIRWVHHAGLDDRLMQVLLVVGLTAGTLGMGFIALQRYRPSRAEVGTGVGIGLYNLVALLVILTTLARMDAVVYFPVTGCTVVILDGLVAHLFWKERLNYLAWLGAGLVAMAMVLVLGEEL